MIDLKAILEYIDPSDCNYQEWVNVGMALKHEGYTAADWDAWSARDGGRYHAGECFKKWATFEGTGTPVTGGTIVQMAKDRGWSPALSSDPGYSLDWDSVIQQDDVVIVDKGWVEAREIKEPVSWDPVKELITYLETLFESDENVGYVTRSFERDGKYLPTKGCWDRSAGQLIEADLDLVLGNDITSPVAIHEINKMKVEGVFNKDKIALVMDHFAPNKDIKSAEHCKCVREFACKNEITNYFDVGKMGIEHALLPEQGLTVAGDVIIGADSHTCTYGALGAFSTGVGSTDMAAGMATGKAWFKVPSAIKFNLTGKLNKWVSGKDVILHIIGMIGVDGALYKSMEFTGPGVSTLTMDDRFTIANMAIEAGGKNGIFPVDDLAREYMKEHSKRPFVEYTADDDAEYEKVYDIDLSTIKSTVAFPHLPENTHTVDSIDDIKIDQVVIGSCTNGRIDDLRCAAKILEGRKVAKGLRVIVIPATQKIYMQAIEEGLVQTFIKAGAVVSTPTCGPCLGGYMGILAEGERCVSTTNRNFVGRMGHVDSEIYLASPAVAAASAVTGKISQPSELGL